jgi:hypothetical protein
MTASANSFVVSWQGGLLAALLAIALCPQAIAQTAQSQPFPSAYNLEQQNQSQPSPIGLGTASGDPVLPAFGSPNATPGQTRNTPATTDPSARPLSEMSQIPGAPTPLSYDRLVAILNEQPDAMVEVKSLVADLAQQHGVSIQPDSITDEMLLSRIATSPELRANITTFLRARGYLTGEEMSGTALNEDPEDMSLAIPSPTPSMLRPNFAPDSQLGSPIAGNTPAWDNSGTSRTTDSMRGRVQHRPQPDDSNRPTHTGSETQVLHRPTPANLLSLRDLYTQLPEPDGKLKRFGSDVFLQRGTTSNGEFAAQERGIPIDVPAGPDYVVGPGDSLSIDIWGGTAQSLTRIIDREGRVSLPESGAIQVAGLTLERAQGEITDALKHQYRDVQVAVTVARLRSIRVYVVGDVQRPGAYDISSLATSLNAAAVSSAKSTSTSFCCMAFAQRIV